jgi:hypothetical protein
MLANVRFSRVSAGGLIVAAVVTGGIAQAAPPAKGKPQPAAPAPAPTPAPAPAQNPEAVQNARTHFAAGVNLLRDPLKPRYEEAYREFKTAYSLSPAVQILGNLGLCAMMLERDSEAIEAYENYLKGMIDIAPAEKEQIERDLSTLKLGVAKVTFTSNIPDTTIIDKRVPTQGDAVNNVYGPMMAFTPMQIGIRQGHHIITARANGKELTWEVDAPGGDLGVHPFEFQEEKAPTPVNNNANPITYQPPPPPPDRPIPKTFWYGVGATAVFGVATVVMGIVSVGEKSSYNDANNGTNPERADTLRTRAQAFNVTTDVLLLGTVAAAAITGFIYVTRPEKEREPPPAINAFLKGVRF